MNQSKSGEELFTRQRRERAAELIAAIIRKRRRVDTDELDKECLNVSAAFEPMNAREAYYRRMAQRYRELAAGSPDLEMVEGWRALADECDKLAEAMNASPESDGISMQRQPTQRRQQKKPQDET